MPTRFASFSSFLALFFFLATPTSLPAQEPGPDQFDISGIKLGRHGGPALKKEIEALPERYKCLDINIEKNGQKKLMGYSCFVPQAPNSPFKEVSFKAIEILNNATSQLFFLFDEDSSNVWFIFKMEKFKNEKDAPLPTTLAEALEKKYGKCDKWSMGCVWSFDRNGKKSSFWFGLSGLSNFPSIKSAPYSSVPIPTSFKADQGIGLEVSVESNNYQLILYDVRDQYDRWAAAKAKMDAAKKAEEERKQAIPAPSF